MTIAKDFASKFAVAFVAVAMIFAAIAPAVQADEAEDLQDTINDLLAQVAALQAQMGGDTTTTTTTTTTTSSCDVPMAPLTMGAQGAGVTALQNILISGGFTIPAGATGYFGAQTQSALAAWQAANGVAPAAGYYGPITMAALQADCVPADEDEDEDDSDDEGSDELSGEASLDNFEVADGDDADDVEEGSEDIAVGEFTVEFSDGDAEISRIDLALEVDSGNDGDDDPWKVFETISLWVDGDMVADIDVSDEDNYLDEDDGSLRFSDLGIIAMEDEEVIITVGATVNSSVDGAADGEGWNIAAGAIRFFDADGVATTEDTAFDLQDLTGTLAAPIAEFTIEEAGAGDDLDLESSDSDPEGTTLALEEDDNVEHEIFAFDLSAEDSDGDVTLNELTIQTSVTVATNVDDLVNDFSLEIDGQSFDVESYVGTTKGATLVFDIDGDVTIDAEETLTAILTADFEDMESGDEGSTIAASTSASTIDAEGADDITADGGTVSSDTHTLRTTGLVLGSEPTDGQDSNDSTQTVSGVSTDANTGDMFLEFEVTAFGEDVWVEADDAVLGTAGNDGLRYQILKAGVATSTDFVGGAAEYTIEGATKTNGFYKLDEGETYTVTVTVEGLNPEVTGSYSFKVNSVGYNDTTETAADANSTPASSSDYEADSVQIAS